MQPTSYLVGVIDFQQGRIDPSVGDPVTEAGRLEPLEVLFDLLLPDGLEDVLALVHLVLAAAKQQARASLVSTLRAAGLSPPAPVDWRDSASSR